jgi:protein-export SecD/SecF family membrane protein
MKLIAKELSRIGQDLANLGDTIHSSRVLLAHETVMSLSRVAGEEESDFTIAARRLSAELTPTKKKSGWWDPPHNYLINMTLMGTLNCWVFTILPKFAAKTAYRPASGNLPEGLVIDPNWGPDYGGPTKGETFDPTEKTLDILIREAKSMATVQHTVQHELKWVETKFGVEIPDGKAVISGNFTADAAKALVRDLNYGALPVPIELISTETIGASLGKDAATSGVKAGIVGFALIVAFLLLWYRLPGFIASLSLVIYIILSLAVFKLIPVTFTAAGIAGFILSIGMAVDANVLIFERMKEELKKGKSVHDALHEGFSRAWLSIRDSNISSMITAVILFWLGTSAIKGFALTLGLGVLISMFTAITVSRTFLFAIAPRDTNKPASKLVKFLFSNGLHI